MSPMDEGAAASTTAGAGGEPTRRPPGLALVVNSLPPYRVHFHLRLVRELTGYTIWTLVTHENAGDRWGYHPPAAINAILFGPGEESDNQGRLWTTLREYQKAGWIIDWIRRENIKAVVLFGYNDLGRARILWWCRQHSIPCYIFADSNALIDTPPFLKASLKSLVVRTLTRLSTGIFVCGANGEAYFRSYGASTKKLFRMPYEPDIDGIQKIESRSIRSVLNEYGLQSERRRIVASSRLISWKRVDLVIDAFVRVASRRANWDLVIVGDGPLRSSLEARVPQELRDRVRWTGFIGDQSKISAIYRGSDVLVFASKREAWGLVVSEAAAAGMALVTAATVGSAIEFVHEGVNGYTFPVDDLDELTKRLLVVTDDQHVDRFKRASLTVLARWREANDPVAGLRNALRRGRGASVADVT